MYTPEFKNILTSTLDGLRAEGLYKEERFIASQPVSYTHLDVYKRQCFSSIPLPVPGGGSLRMFRTWRKPREARPERGL